MHTAFSRAQLLRKALPPLLLKQYPNVCGVLQVTNGAMQEGPNNGELHKRVIRGNEPFPLADEENLLSQSRGGRYSNVVEKHSAVEKASKDSRSFPVGETTTMELSNPFCPTDKNDSEQECTQAMNEEEEPKLSSEKCIVLKMALNGASLFIGGDAGTGKSFLLRRIANKLEKRGLRVALTASTGIAALGIGGNTFHGTFGVPVVSGDEKSSADAGASPRIWFDPDSLATLDVIIVDEVSLLHAGHIEGLDLAARAAPGKAQHVPFGGIQVILGGDFMQLMHSASWNEANQRRILCKGLDRNGDAVQGSTEEKKGVMISLNDENVAGKHLYTKPGDDMPSLGSRRRNMRRFYARPVFESPVFHHCLIHVRLSEVVRQAEDPAFLADLNKLRFGVLTHRLSRSAVRNPEDPNAIRLFPTKRAVIAFNASKMLELDGEERCFRSELQVSGCGSRTRASASGCGNSGGRSNALKEVLILHFRDKMMHSTKWRREAERLVYELCSCCHLSSAVRTMIPPVASRYCRHLCVYVRFVDKPRNEMVKAMSALQAAIGDKFLARTKEAEVARKLWGTVFWEVRQDDYLERSLRSAFERRYSKIIQHDYLFQHKRLKVGCRVMLLRNLNKQYVNGSLGTIVSFQPFRNVRHLLPSNLKVLLSRSHYAFLQRKQQLSGAPDPWKQTAEDIGDNNSDETIVPVVQMDSDGNEVAIPWISISMPAELREGFCAVRVVVMPLAPAYAYTVHKVQGITFDHSLLFDGSGCFPCDHLVYVAASRVRFSSQFRMVNVSPRMISVHAGALRFSSSLHNATEAAAAWKGWKNAQTSKEALSSLSKFSLYYAAWKLRRRQNEKHDK
ncbi:PIF1 helicase-like protein [Trypanosoma grayi]|uniref:PIF1 helicase-like protein n=1 Tax=Trypanosoma grayi TaxID=71804 RepID=UPI0004F40F29|nr:PIF1 helicase-like protein [Trypanosoma grayi]KEG15387.1 PIF1 helicase-like protein [Trypanosoma grayi]